MRVVDAGSLAADACLLINLFATGRVIEVVEALDLRLVTTERARREAGFLQDRDDDGEIVKVPIDHGLLEASRRLQVVELHEADAPALVRAAEHLSDVDAHVAALAIGRGLPLGTDDRYMRRVVSMLDDGVEMVGTFALVRAAADVLSWSRGEIAAVLHSLRERACFIPPRDDPDAAWAKAVIEGAD